MFNIKLKKDISSDKRLSDKEKSLALLLAEKRDSSNGICNPDAVYLTNQMGYKNFAQITKILKKLEDKKILLIFKNRNLKNYFFGFDYDLCFNLYCNYVSNNNKLLRGFYGYSK